MIPSAEVTESCQGMGLKMPSGMYVVGERKEYQKGVHVLEHLWTGGSEQAID